MREELAQKEGGYRTDEMTLELEITQLNHELARTEVQIMKATGENENVLLGAREE